MPSKEKLRAQFAMNSSDEAPRDRMNWLLLRVVPKEASKDAINPRASVVTSFSRKRLAFGLLYC